LDFNPDIALSASNFLLIAVQEGKDLSAFSQHQAV
jgi:hypothetical protein